MCCVRFPEWEKHWSHTLHLQGFSPVCMLMCTLRWEESFKIFVTDSALMVLSSLSLRVFLAWLPTIWVILPLHRCDPWQQKHKDSQFCNLSHLPHYCWCAVFLYLKYTEHHRLECVEIIHTLNDATSLSQHKYTLCITKTIWLLTSYTGGALNE